MIRAWLAVAAVAGAAATLGAQAPGRLRSGVDLVTVDVLVTDGRRPIAGLRATDFEVRDEGILQSVVQVQIEALPLNVIFVLDTSQSVAGSRLRHLKTAATAIVDMLGPSDRAALLTFSHRLRRHTGLTAELDRVRRLIQDVTVSGGTALRDAAAVGLTLRGTDRGRALLVLFSDGLDTASFLTAARVLDAASRSDVVVYGVGFPAQGPTVDGSLVRRVSPATDNAFLRALASATGGRVETADDDDDIARAFGRVFAEFKARYVLGFTPTGVSSSGWHPLDVRLRNRAGVVTARRGYFAK